MTTVASLIERHREEIIRHWSLEASRAASMHGLPRPELTAFMPHYVAALARGGQTNAERRQLIANHLSSRVREGFHCDEVVHEFSLLGRAIRTVIWSSDVGGERPEILDLEGLFEELNDAATVATEVYERHFEYGEQTERFYLRRLQAITSEALRGVENSRLFRTRLNEVARLVMEAMGAQTAAIFLTDRRTHDLVTAASAGTVAEPVRPWSLEAAGASFVASIAASEQGTTALPDALSSELAVSDELRRSGIRSLLGVRLLGARELHGVAYVGLSERRVWSAREVHRLEVMGQWLNLHLDNARLYEQLHETMEALNTERSLRQRLVTVCGRGVLDALTSARRAAEQLVRDAERKGIERGFATTLVGGIGDVERAVREEIAAQTNRFVATPSEAGIRG